MKIGRTIPPAAAPLGWRDLRNSLGGMLFPERSLRALEESVRAHLAARHVFLVSSGTAALTVALAALKSMSRRTEVVIPAYTCFSVPAAVLEAGLRPVLCDINPSTFDFDETQFERTLHADTLCVVAHHLYGVPTNVEKVRRICRAHGVYVIEDAAQGMGVESNGRALGTTGDVGIFSLGRGKAVTCGSGGMVVTGSARIAIAVSAQVRALKPVSALQALNDFVQLVVMAIFIRPRLYWLPAAVPFLKLGQTIFPRTVTLRRMSGVKAGALRDWRARLTAGNTARAATAAFYGRRLSLPLPHGAAHPYLRLPILARDKNTRDRIHAASERRGLGLGVGYPTPINEIPEIRGLFGGQRFPAARLVADLLLTLPTHHWLSENDRRAIAQCVETNERAVRRSRQMAERAVSVS